MKRVQLILEEWQHEWLGTEAEKSDTSMSALLRQLLTEAIELRQSANLADDPLWGIIGMAEGPDDGISSENLDEYLYAQPATSRAPVLKMAEPKAEYTVNQDDSSSNEPSTSLEHSEANDDD